MLLEHATILAFNFAASVAVIFINKLLFTSFAFRYTTLLTALHYVVTIIGLEILAALNVYERRASPATPRLLILSAVVGTAPALNNLSLSLNNLGFYQVVKLLVTPAIVGLEAHLYSKCLSLPRALALLGVCVGVGLAVVNDVSINAPGLMAACAWVPVAAVYKVLWSRVSKEESWHVFALMRWVMPRSTCLLLCLVPIIDPPGAFTGGFEWSVERVALIALSGAAAFLVNWSGFLVMGACSALTHTVLGQLKAVITILGGFFLFHQVYPPKAVAGAAVAVVAMVWYTKANLEESSPKNTPSGGGGSGAGAAVKRNRSDPSVELQERANNGGDESDAEGSGAERVRAPLLARGAESYFRDVGVVGQKAAGNEK